MEKEKVRLGTVAFTPKGKWDAETEYKRLNVVHFLASSYYAKQDNVGQTPSLDSEYWGLLVEGGDVTNNPDEEDITEVVENDAHVLKLADRDYNPDNFSGKGHKILRKNVKNIDLAVTKVTVNSVPTADGEISITINNVDSHITLSKDTHNTTALAATAISEALATDHKDYDVVAEENVITLTRKHSGAVEASAYDVNETGMTLALEDSTKTVKRNILTSAMMSQSDTIYEIRYDFDLDGETVTIPEECILKFEGGKIDNGVLDLAKQSVGADKNTCVFGADLEVKNITYLSVKWFGAKGDGETDDTKALRMALIRSDCHCLLPIGRYVITKTIDALKLYVSWIGEGYNTVDCWTNTMKTNGVAIYCKGDNDGVPFIYLPQEVRNISFTGEIGESYLKPKYENSIGVSCGKPASWEVGGRYRDLSFFFFGKGLNIENCFDLQFIGLYISRCTDGLYFNVEEEKGKDSGYVTIMKIENFAITGNTSHGVYAKPRGMLNVEFNHGYIEGNGGMDDYEIYVKHYGNFVFNYLYSEGTNPFIYNFTGSLIFNHCNLATSKIRADYTSLRMFNTRMSDCTVETGPNPVALISSTIKGLSFNSNTFENSDIEILNSIIRNIGDQPFTRTNLPMVDSTNSNSFTGLVSRYADTNTLVWLTDKDKLAIFNSKTWKFKGIDGKTLALDYGTSFPSFDDTDIGRHFYNTNYDMDYIHTSEGNVPVLGKSKTTIAYENADNVKQFLIIRVKQNFQFDPVFDILLEYNYPTKYVNLHVTAAFYGRDDSIKDTPLVSMQNVQDVAKVPVWVASHYRAESPDWSFMATVVIPLFNASDENIVPSKIHVVTTNKTKCTIETSVENKYICRYTYLYPKSQTTPIARNVFCGARTFGTTEERPTELGDLYPNFMYFDTTKKMPIWWNGSKWIDNKGNPADAKQLGATAERPAGVNVGYIFKDTTLGKLIVWDGSAWVNMDGSSLDAVTQSAETPKEVADDSTSVNEGDTTVVNEEDATATENKVTEDPT